MTRDLVRASVVIFLVSMVTLMVELVFTRLFDVLLTTNISYVVVTCALFSLGLSGAIVAIRPVQENADIGPVLWKSLSLYAVAIVASVFLINLVPFDIDAVGSHPITQLMSFGALFVIIVAPFVFAGFVFSYVFSAYSARMQYLYFFDLVGAAIGCVAIIPLLPRLGPGGILVLCGALVLLCASLFLSGDARRYLGFGAALAVAFCAVHGGDDWFAFRYHTDKRHVLTAVAAGMREYSIWDPVSKIDIIKETDFRKHIAYDGGNQSSFFYKFDGNLPKLRANFLQTIDKNYWGLGELGSHYLFRDTGYDALVIGAAGGKETKAALMFGAGHVDAVEMVGSVMDLATTRYGDFIGNVYKDPKVSVIVDEGRTFLRATDKKYDVIQIFSNHTSSSIASGTGAMATTYLQTVEAYKEYFRHLKPGGVLHINHHIYEREVVDAAQAWKEMGRSDFGRHLLVYNSSDVNLPTMLIKMSPWSEAEVRQMDDLYLRTDVGRRLGYQKVEDPLHPGKGFLSPVFFAGELPKALQAKIPYQIRATTDDRPYFNQLRKRFGRLSVNPAAYVDEGVANVLNSQLRKDIVPMDLIHLAILPLYALVIVAVVIGLPLRYSRIGREQWAQKTPMLLYFSCLGFGFIVVEIVFIQLFMKLVGPPLYTYSAVLFGMLFGAGLGSFASARIGITPSRRWWWPFVGILAAMSAFLAAHDVLFETFLGAPLALRIAAALAMIFPLSFFMGMPFPLGVLVAEKFPRGAVAWAWAVNGVSTVLGGFLAIVISLLAGFSAALVVGWCAYGLAFVALRALVPRRGAVEVGRADLQAA
jgi:spermidine synthase